MPIGEYTVTSAAQLVELVNGIRREFGDGRPLWFRGHQCSDFSLTPSLYREIASFDTAIQRERRLITRFRQRSLPFWPAGYPQTDWEHLFAMQHNGVPTRLLDWSENLMVALYFALHPEHAHGAPTGSAVPAGAVNEQHAAVVVHGAIDGPEAVAAVPAPAPGEGVAAPEVKDVAAPCHPVVWCLDPVAWNRAVLREFAEDVAILTTGDSELEKYGPEIENRLLARPQTGVAIYGTHNSPRIVAQRGTFTIAGKSTQSMEQLSATLSNETLLWRIGIYGDVADVAFELATIGVTESMVYPDLPGLALELRKQVW